MISNKIDIFKPYLSGTPAYVGGKSIKEIETSADKIYKLSSNENPLGSSPMAIQAIADNIHKLYEYPDRTDLSLRTALKEFYKNELAEDCFLTAPSGSEIIDIIVRGFTGEGLNCIACNPAFQPYFMFAKNHGAVTSDVPLSAGDYALDVDGILNRVDDDTRLVFLTSPNNPTGTYITADTIQYLLDNLPSHVIVVLDEVYHHFVDAPDYSTALPFVNKGYQIIGLNSFSKAYGLAGLRVGYSYGPSEIMNYLRQLCKPFLMGTPTLAAAKAALLDTEFISKTRNHVLKERNRICQELNRLEIEYWPSQGNFILIKPGVNDKLFESIMLEKGLMVRPVTGFGVPDCVRVSIGTVEANTTLIAALSEFSENYKIGKYAGN